MARPVIGFGTWVDVEGGADPTVMQGVVVEALKIGYRRFDTAHDYKTEEYVLKAISQVLCILFCGYFD
jgi:diketogulonate reductase-like aldo/keto reductase